jgi:hypothetical protein
MTKLLGETNKTGVKLFINTLICGILLISLSSFAASKKKDTADGKDDGSDIEEPKANKKSGSDVDWESKWNKDKCDELRRDAREAQNKIGEACKNAGLGGECAAKAQACDEQMGQESYSTLDAIMTTMGMPATATSSDMQNSCPQWSSKDYYEKQKEYRDDLDQTKKDIAQFAKDKAQVEKDFKDKLADIQKDLNDAQKALDELKLSQKDDTRKRMKEFQENQANLQKQLSQNGLNAIKLETELKNALLTATNELINVNEENSSRTCREAMVTKQLEARNDPKKKAVSVHMSGHIAQGTTKNGDIESVYSNCMKTMQLRRQAAMVKKQSDEASIRKQIAMNEEEGKQLEQNINLAGSQLAEIQADAKTAGDNATNDVLKKMSLAQQQMTTEKTNMDQQLAAIKAEETAANQKLNQINSDMAMVLGSKPKAGSTSTANEAASVISAQQDTIDDWNNSTCDGAGGKAAVSKKKAARADRNQQ